MGCMAVWQGKAETEIESLKAQLKGKESRIKKLKDGLMVLIDKCEECDGWEGFSFFIY